MDLEKNRINQQPNQLVKNQQFLFHRHALSTCPFHITKYLCLTVCTLYYIELNVKMVHHKVFEQITKAVWKAQSSRSILHVCLQSSPLVRTVKVVFEQQSKAFSLCVSPLSETNDVDPELISCIRPLRLPHPLAVCCLASTVVKQIGTNKSQVYSFTGVALTFTTPRRLRSHI